MTRLSDVIGLLLSSVGIALLLLSLVIVPINSTLTAGTGTGCTNVDCPTCLQTDDGGCGATKCTCSGATCACTPKNIGNGCTCKDV